MEFRLCGCQKEQKQQPHTRRNSRHDIICINLNNCSSRERKRRESSFCFLHIYIPSSSSFAVTPPYVFLSVIVQGVTDDDRSFIDVAAGICSSRRPYPAGLNGFSLFILLLFQTVNWIHTARLFDPRVALLSSASQGFDSHDKTQQSKFTNLVNHSSQSNFSSLGVCARLVLPVDDEIMNNDY